MYLAEYPDPQLGGLGSKLKKVVKKVVKPALHIGAAILTSGASLAVSAQMIAADKAKKAAAAEQARLNAAAAEEQKRIDALNAQTVAIQAQTAKTRPATEVAAAASPMTSVSTVAPSAAAVAALQPQAPAPVYLTQPASQGYDRPEPAQAPAAGMPSWVVPAGGAAAVLLLVMMTRGNRANR